MNSEHTRKKSSLTNKLVFTKKKRKARFREHKRYVMKESMKLVFKCDHCGKNYLRRNACETHEKYCSKNPENKHACFSCKYLSVDVVRNDDGYDEKTFNCLSKDIEMHSFKAEKIGHSCLGRTERMPINCDQYDIDTLTY